MFYPLFLVLALAWAVSASSLSEENSLDNQLPPVARIDKEYSWTFSPNTFGGSCDAEPTYTASDLPGWLFFEPLTRTFHGTPSESDGGRPDITVTAHGCGSSASSWFDIPVTSAQPPIPHIPIETQFTSDNPALSSVYTLARCSALATANPALRIPPKWSYSIGIDGQTFISDGDVFYDALQSDGSPLPSWIMFNPKALTFNGVTLKEDVEATPYTLSLALHASDQKGYTSSVLYFDIIVAPHELSGCSPLPTINVTAEEPFSLLLGSPSDFAGVAIDGSDIQPSNISTLSIDTSQYPGLKYDGQTRTLSGNLLDSHGSASFQRPLLPVTLITTFNESLHTNVSIALVPSYFSCDELPVLSVGEDGDIQFSLAPFHSNSTSAEQGGEVNLTASFDPPESCNFLSFDRATERLSGTAPPDLNYTRINATFTAYSWLTHSTSHTNLQIMLSTVHKDKKGYTHPSNLSAAAHKRLVLGIGITFGLVGGVCALGLLLAVFRRCASVGDTALAGEEGQSGWSEKDKKWYGVGQGNSDENLGYGWTADRPRNAMDVQNPSDAKVATHVRPVHGYGNLELHRVMERSQSSSPTPGSTTGSHITSPGVMSKREFMTRIKHTVRTVSDKYTRIRQKPLELSRPVIGKPILITSSKVLSPNPFDDANGNSGRSSPRSPTMIRFADRLSRHASNESIASNASDRTHAAEAVVQTASKANVRGASYRSQDSGVSERPRLVPFTSSSRVPVPQTSPISPDGSQSSHGLSARVASQKARICKNGDDQVPTDSRDDLSMGIHYVRELGSSRPVNTAPSTLTVSTNVRSSFSSIGSLPQGPANGRSDEAVKMLVRAGEQFKFRVSLRFPSPASNKHRKLSARLSSGGVLPRFLHVDLNSNRRQEAVEFYGVPSQRDTGELDVGVYSSEDGVCVARVILEIAGKASSSR